AERESQNDRSVHLAAAPPDPRQITDRHRDRQHGHRRAQAEHPRDERQHDDPGTESGDTADQGAHERADDEDYPTDWIGHVVSSYAECPDGSPRRARSSSRSTP